MKCFEDVIVTLRFLPEGRCIDMELPAFLPVEALTRRLMETLREMDPLRFGTVSAISLSKKEEKLCGECTLAQAGVWDGTVLDVTVCG